MTIRTRLALWYSILLTTTIIIFSVMVTAVSRASVLSTIDHVLDLTSAEIIGDITVVSRDESGGLLTRVTFRTEQLFKAPGLSVQVWQTHDNGVPIEPVLVKTSSYLTGFNQALDLVALHADNNQYNNITIDNTPVRVSTHEFRDAFGREVGVVQVATSIETYEQANDTLIAIVLAGAVVSIVISAAISNQMARRVLKPIEKVTYAAASIVDARDLSTRIAWAGPMDELGQLSQMFNRMMERLQHLFSVQQRFVGDVSHEMRTPLTSILGHLEIMDRYGIDKESLEAVHREAGRMSRMVSDLLMLARADNGEIQVELFALDLDAVVLEVYEQAMILAKGRSLKITMERIDPVRIMGNSDRLKQLMLNLVNNAIKFTPDNGKIALSVYPRDQFAMLEVRDTGIGIAEKDLQRIFDRFFQADNSRVHHTDEDGAGLGLSIVRWIVDAHYGKIDVVSKLNEGTAFRVQIPLLEEGKSLPESDQFPATKTIKDEIAEQ